MNKKQEKPRKLIELKKLEGYTEKEMKEMFVETYCWLARVKPDWIEAAEKQLAFERMKTLLEHKQESDKN